MAKIEEYLKNENNQASSTRLFSWYMLWFYFLFNIIILAIVVVYILKAGGDTGKVLSVDLIVYFATFNFLQLVGIFVPKQLGKSKEVAESITKLQQSLKT